MKAIVTLLILAGGSQSHAGIDFNTEINQASAEQYNLNQKVIAAGGGSEETDKFEKTWRDPLSKEASISPVRMMKLRFKRVKLAAR